MTRPIIALDADGVLLDYNLAYADVWERAYGVRPIERDPDAYWAKDRWDVPHLADEALSQFRRFFDEAFWSSLPAMAGAIEACQLLHDAGHELVCVTAMQPQFAQARESNLRKLGFPISRVLATGGDASRGSPKRSALEQIDAQVLVDDYLPFLVGLPEPVHRALIDRNPARSPNRGSERETLSSSHPDLRSFTQWWLSRL
ncbi:HAD family hydrolase [Niveibacterium sp. COAC-50]|uniref:HAD family hydrolase n=1 Tax=Niveibacterium sp. COAC-50 TaxID=2729384 RepID=UPI0015576EF8|nr:HAD family hydrolase [Niveibacterium sp. COAC-50]